jgi:hypothetical protein
LSEKIGFLQLVRDFNDVLWVDRMKRKMVKETKPKDPLGVDKGLVSMFLKMSPEERLQANDKAVRTIMELRNAYQQRKTNRRGPKRNT